MITDDKFWPRSMSACVSFNSIIKQTMCHLIFQTWWVHSVHSNVIALTSLSLSVFSPVKMVFLKRNSLPPTPLFLPDSGWRPPSSSHILKQGPISWVFFYYSHWWLLQPDFTMWEDRYHLLLSSLNLQDIVNWLFTSLKIIFLTSYYKKYWFF